MWKRKVFFAALFAPLAILFLSAQISAPPVYSPKLGIGGAPPTSNGDLRVYGNFQLDGTCTGCPTTPVGGSNTQVQYNNAGALGGDAGFTYNATTDTATIGTIAATSGTIGGSNICRADGTNCPAVSAGGSNTQVQFNNSNALGGDAGFVYNSATDTATIGIVTASTGVIAPILNSSAALALSTTGANGMTFATNGNTRLELTDTGAYLIGGTTGTSGQVLTSAGSSASPTWSNPSIAKTCTSSCDLTGLLVGQSAMIRKPNTQSVTSSATLTADNELQFSNAPAGGYIMEGLYQVTDGGGGVRVGFSASGVSATGNTSCGGTLQVLSVTTTNPGAMQCATAATSVFTYQGIITRGSAGSITVMFAQQTSNAASTTMGTNSYVMLTRYY